MPVQLAKCGGDGAEGHGSFRGKLGIWYVDMFSLDASQILGPCYQKVEAGIQIPVGSRPTFSCLQKCAL